METEIASHPTMSLLLLAFLVSCGNDKHTDTGIGADTDTDTDVDTDTDADTDSDTDADTSLADAEAKMLGVGEGDISGDKVFMAGDVNDDGHADVIVGAKKHLGNGPNSGAAFVLLGPLSGQFSLSIAEARLKGEGLGDFAGGSVSTAGDVDNDGFSDVLVGAKLQDPAGNGIMKGAAYLVRGPFSGDIDLSSADARFDGEFEGDTAGGTVRAVGDTNNDDNDDILITAKLSDTNGDDSGSAYLFTGPLAGAYSLGSDETARFLGENAGDQAGGSASGAGDIDGDGLDDVALCGCLDDTSATDAGVVYILRAPFVGDVFLSDADARWYGEEQADSVGYTAGIGDLTGDGLDDIGVGSSQHDDGGAFYIVEGTATGDHDLRDAWVRGLGTSGQLLGVSLTGAGDFNGDQVPDVAIGASGDDDGVGLVLVFYGPVSGALDPVDADRRFVGEAPNDNAGFEVSGGQDIDADGIDDLVIGAPGEDTIGDDAGATYVVLGG